MYYSTSIKDVVSAKERMGFKKKSLFSKNKILFSFVSFSVAVIPFFYTYISGGVS